ncbi:MULTISPECIES: glycosyltransferase family 4 protein [Bradyrhizobium]|jgi:glycosyltransferase involved in cell wall biosynthesis|uniref:Glycosyltransferase involved in cell wall bisynthesis n=2 Tax=Bradyrhizobium TaxID=374 RepID=A0ABY0PTC6_9BRAD|nr:MULTISPECIES: glycosyltransferase family 1 protein [Bradyrhizobium]SDI91983.1 Glycosyltransferase involved in cell wall bisynthesis [Bradyrhizobium ottawaense]SED08540.1 Glycosyltransferase involved in cell wall bisynthesis [Bradyrhizobium lablabi]SHL14784.1 Glycosyltransferase involved in cell wall bisynthesis [Bradyrhizobium lablabi]
MRVLVATDAWRPQVNGVVRSLENLATEAPSFGADITFLTPQDFPTLPLPGYREIQLALPSPGTVKRAIAAARPESVHIATEGPIGWVTRSVCRREGYPFTTSYHTRFPEYLAARLPVPLAWSYSALRRFHNSGAGIMVGTPTLERDLKARGFCKLMQWSPGVDADVFRPRLERPLAFPKPVFLFVGRISIEKNIAAFLALDLPGSMVVVGDGPLRAKLETEFPNAHFLGVRSGEALAEVYASADVFVFPSLTDTFGIVLLEALACGLPVAAFPVMGPLDVIDRSGCGRLDMNLHRAAIGALDISRQQCRAYALNFTWRESARQFLDNIRHAHGM